MALPTSSGNPYSSVDLGFAALPVEELLASNDDLIGRIRLCFGIDRDTFDHARGAHIIRVGDLGRCSPHRLCAGADGAFHPLRFVVGVVRAPGVRSSRRRSWALSATTTVEADMRIAPTLIGRTNPIGASTPAASGTATRL